MKVTTFLAALALGSTATAQQFGPPSWWGRRPTGPPPGYQSSPPSGYQGGPPSGYQFGPPAGGPPSGVAQGPRPSGSPLGFGTGIAGDKTQAAGAYGQFKTIVPAIPTSAPKVASNSTSAGSGSASASSNSTASAGGSSNSTSSANSTLISTSDDAKKNPNLPNSATHRGNWAPGFDINTDAETSWPTTGNTVKMTLTITNGTIAPQGDSKIGFLINGQYPGPLIRANWGDNLEITVVNQLQNNGTSIHWHGFTQKGTNMNDGVGGVTECPIAPGNSKVYKFQATQYGSFWYHSHFSGQYGDGVLGPIIVDGPTSYNYDTDLGTVIIGDYYPLTAFQEQWIAERNGPPTATNYLLNGKNVKIDGSAGSRAQWTFAAGKAHKLRLMNAGVESHFKFQIDGHSLIVVSSDLTPIQPYRTNEISIATGQRYDVIVIADQPVGNYWARAMAATDCSFIANDGTGSVANGVISYSGASNALPTSKPFTHSNACVDEALAALQPIVSKTVDSGSFAAQASSLGVGANTVSSSNDTVFRWTIGGISQLIDWSNPTMSNAGISTNNTFDAVKHVVSLPTANVWTYWVLQNQFYVPHPMHVHGHTFAILGQGSGTFNSASASSTLNFQNPPRRDVVYLTANGWTVVAFKTDNPGAWLMHCHLSWHSSGGLSLQYLERPLELPGLFASQVKSSDYVNNCAAWKKYAPTMVYPQSDSGLRKREVIGGAELEMIQLDELPERRGLEIETAVVRREVKYFV